MMKRGLIVLVVAMVMSWGGRITVEAESRAFLVGISDYGYWRDGIRNGDVWEDIHGGNDVEWIKPALEQSGFKVYPLCDGEATGANIRKGLAQFAEGCREGDTVYIHFSCHGQPVEDRDGDEDDGWDEAIVAADAGKVYTAGVYEGENHITDDELNVIFRTIRMKVGKKGYVTVVVDACHAGTMYRGDEEVTEPVVVRGSDKGFSASGRVFVPKIDRRSSFKVESSDEMSGICLIEACRSYQMNNEIREDGVYYGALSYYTGKVMRNGSIDWRSRWYESVVEMMGNDRRLIGQNPVIERGE